MSVYLVVVSVRRRHVSHLLLFLLCQLRRSIPVSLGVLPPARGQVDDTHRRRKAEERQTDNVTGSVARLVLFPKSKRRDDSADYNQLARYCAGSVTTYYFQTRSARRFRRYVGGVRPDSWQTNTQ